MAGEMIRDTAYIGNRLSWQGAAILGFVLITLEAAFGRRIHWLQYLGIALGLIGLFFAIRNYFAYDRLDRGGEHNVGWFSRILAKLID